MENRLLKELDSHSTTHEWEFTLATSTTLKEVGMKMHWMDINELRKLIYIDCC